MRDRSQHGSGRIVWGVFLIVVGVAFLLDRLHFSDFGYLVESYWPMILVAIGLGRLLTPGMRHRGLWLIGIGGWLQVSNLGMWGFGWSNSWPILLVVVGGCIVLEAMFPERRQSHRDRDSVGPPREGP